MIFHLLPAAEAPGVLAQAEYRPPSLEQQGFIHAAGSAAQALRVANRLFRQHERVAVLCIARARVRAEIREEEAGDAEPFPHIYGPLNTDAIVEVRELRRDASGLSVGL